MPRPEGCRKVNAEHGSFGAVESGEPEDGVSEISLVVTKAALAHGSDHPNQRQIAMRSPSSSIEPLVRTLTSGNRAHLTLGGFLTLDVGDPAAIWLAHNEKHAKAFETLYALLARKPDGEMRFLCEITPLPQEKP